MRWAIEQQEWLGIPVVLVPGNHEYYRQDMTVLEKRYTSLARNAHGLHLLQCGRFDVGNYAILGCTLWTDFALGGDVASSEYAAANFMLDYRCISMGDRLMVPADTVAIHREHRRWLQAELQKVHAEGKQAIVVTHHGPSPRSSSSLNPAFVSDLSSWMKTDWAPALWIHGHTHDVFDYHEGRTRVVANPRGYPYEQSSTGDFDWQKVVELTPPNENSAEK